MIQELVDRFMAKKSELEAVFAKEHPETYKAIVKAVVTAVTDDDDQHRLDPECIRVVDDGDYQGTLLFIIKEKGYQPSRYWYVMVDYGSCSGCDTLEAIGNYGTGPPTPEQIKDYMTLALHVVQGIKEMKGDE